MSNGTKAIMANITGGKIMKVRWNACYAASNILRKEEEEGQWRTDLINCLLDMVINFHNFKVINSQYERAIHGAFIVRQPSSPYWRTCALRSCPVYPFCTPVFSLSLSLVTHLDLEIIQKLSSFVTSGTAWPVIEVEIFPMTGPPNI